MTVTPSAPTTFGTVRVAVDGQIGRLSLNRPERLNALAPATLAELAEAAAWIDEQRDLKVVVVTGSGRSFCAGSDLTAVGSEPAGATGREGAERGRRMVEAVTGIRAMTVAAIQGDCVGGGVVLAVACDLRVAARDARFFIPEIDLGIPLTWGGIPLLVREIGAAATKDLVATCRVFDGIEAERLGLVNRLVEPDQLTATADELAAALAAKSSLVLSATKRQVDDASDVLHEGSSAELEADLFAAGLSDPESRAAALAYIEARFSRRQEP